MGEQYGRASSVAFLLAGQEAGITRRCIIANFHLYLFGLKMMGIKNGWLLNAVPPNKVEDITGLANFLRGCDSQNNGYERRKRQKLFED